MKQQLKIAVCIKQVPDTGKIKWTENNTIDRAHMDSVINLCDEYALEMALDIKESFKAKQTHISVFSMGPDKACEVLKYALALGCDEGYLISDKLFLGSDSYVTSKILAQASLFIKTTLTLLFVDNLPKMVTRLKPARELRLILIYRLLHMFLP